MHFGPFTLDERTWSLARDGSAVELSPRLVEILAFFAGRPGAIVTKDELLERFWPDVHIAENTLTRAVADIRKAIGDDASQPRFLQTVARRGYRFIGGPSPESDDVFAAWVKGRLALDSLELERLSGAVETFERAAAELPSYAPAHAGLANAISCRPKQPVLRARPTTNCSRGLLKQLVGPVRSTRRWAKAGQSLDTCCRRPARRKRLRRRRDGRLPSNQTTGGINIVSRLPPGARNGCAPSIARWRSCPGSGRPTCCRPWYLSHEARWTARSATPRWARTINGNAGTTTHRYRQRGFIGFEASCCTRVATSRGRSPASVKRPPREAMATCTRASLRSTRAWPLGFTRLKLGDALAAEAEFRAALEATAGHARASLGLFAALSQTGNLAGADTMRVCTDEAIGELMRGGRAGEAALVAAGRELVRQRTAEAVDILDRLLSDALPGPAGWIMPVDPMLAGLRLAPGRSPLLAKLAARAA